MTKRRSLTADEIKLWQRATKDVDRRIEQPTPPETPKPPAARLDGLASRQTEYHRAIAEQGTAPPRRSTMPELDPNRPINTDRRTFERLKRGRIPIDRSLDLHGRTQVEAHGALARFLTAASAGGSRCILIVTGKGVDGVGVLRQMVPRWLAEEGNREKIVTYCRAQPHHGGEGALYVLLKRRRN